jgi:hypothetical protein
MTQLRWRAFERFRWVWGGWERLERRLHPVTPIRQGSLFGYQVRGHAVELHLDGHALARMRDAPGYSAFKVVHTLRGDLAALAQRIRGGELGGVSTIRGTSLVGEAGAVLGFETRPVRRSLGAALHRYFMVGLDAVYHPRGLRPRAARRWPYETWMTVDELLRRYPEKSERSTRAR